MLINRDKPRQPPKPRPWPAGKAKPTLPVTHLPIYRVHYKALEAYLARVYRTLDYDFSIATGIPAGSHMAPEYQVRAMLPPAWEAPRKADAIRLGRRSSDIPLILNVLCLDGFIPEGTYIIDMRNLTPPVDVYRALLNETRDTLDPKCIEYRERHKEDRDFVAQAAILDNAVLAWQRDQQSKD